jgi:ribosomal protein S3AE
MVETKKKTKLVLKKKKWYPIIASKLFRESQIGETYLVDPATAIGRKMKVSLMQITGDPKGQNTKIEFKITGQHEGKLLTEVLGYELTNAAMKRMVRRGRTKIQDSVVLETLDKKKIRIKPVVVTRNKILSGAKKELRQRMLAYTKDNVAKLNFENIIIELLNKKFQKTGNETLRKLCPIYTFDIKHLRIIEPKKLG